MTPEPIPYDKFRTGYTWREISDMLWSYSDDPREWHPASPLRRAGKRVKKRAGRRHGILGLWRQIKQEMYDRYLNEFTRADGVPF